MSTHLVVSLIMPLQVKPSLNMSSYLVILLVMSYPPGDLFDDVYPPSGILIMSNHVSTRRMSGFLQYNHHVYLSGNLSDHVYHF
jgi:hypothetical protein